MRLPLRTFLVGSVLVGALTLAGTTPALAQATLAGGGRSLGGYGGEMTETGSGMGMSGASIPYAGKFGGFMPYRMGGTASLSFQSRGTAPSGMGRTSFSLSPMSGGMSAMSGGLGKGLGAGSRISSAFGSSGAMGAGAGMQPMSGSRGPGVMPPNFGYPFRQPPSLLSPTSGGSGMSM